MRRFNPPLKRDSQPSQPLSQGDQLTKSPPVTDGAAHQTPFAAPNQPGSKARPKGFNPPQQTAAGTKVRRVARGEKHNSEAAVAGMEVPGGGLQLVGPKEGGWQVARGGSGGVLDVELSEGDQTYSQITEVGTSPERRSHTVLSYCEDGSLSPPELPPQPGPTGQCDLQDSLSSTGSQGREEDSFLQASNPSGPVGIEGLSYSPGNNYNNDLEYEPLGLIDEGPGHGSENELESSQQVSSLPRRQFKLPKTRPTLYDYSILGKHPPKSAMRKETGKNKRVKLTLPIPDWREGREQSSRGGGGGGRKEREDLEVFDFKPTQQETPSIARTDCEAKLSKLNMSVTGRNKEEQV